MFVPWIPPVSHVTSLKDYGAVLLSAAAPKPVADGGYVWQHYDYCAAQSELTCNNGGPGPTAPSRKRGREHDDELLHYAAFLPLPETRPHSVSITPASTSGRPAEHDAEVDALVRAECDRLRAGLDAARKRQRQVLVRAAAQRMREAWCGVARGNEAVAAGLRATLDALLLRSSTGVDAAEGFGDAEYVEAPDAAATASSSSTAKRACRECGEGEASVLVLPCRHLCLCKACERRTDACPVCAGAKNAAIHIAPN